MRLLATGLPAMRFTTSGAVCGVVMRPCTGAPFFTEGGTTRFVSGLSVLLAPAPPIAPGGIIGIPPICPRALAAESVALVAGICGMGAAAG